MKKILTIVGLLSISLTASAGVIGKAEVTKSVDQIKIHLISDPIQEAPQLRSVFINSPRLEITDSKGEVTIVGVAGIGICSLFGYAGDGRFSPTLPYSYNEEAAKYLVYEDGTVRQIPEGRNLKTIKTAHCGKTN
ncbi:MAG: hypothetical protein B7Y39_14195 [Bdellovibrio sp. 28-41-41]|nr:MAG: hypothetical protein B7Y39_14195 [Bdellovibrio sp. 28-41-41]